MWRLTDVLIMDNLIDISYLLDLSSGWSGLFFGGLGMVVIALCSYRPWSVPFPTYSLYLTQGVVLPILFSLNSISNIVCVCFLMVCLVLFGVLGRFLVIFFFVL